MTTAETHETPQRGPNGERLTVCSACGAPIFFRHNPATGKYTPIALATGESHFRDCSSPRLFSKSTKKKGG
jgi:hypothetical protein